jgi:hypothetical protein
MKHCVYVRMDYKDDVAFLERFALMQQTCTPALLWQEAPFDVQVKVSCTAHARIIKKMTLFTPVFEWNHNYDIRTRHDCDDISLPGYIQRIQQEYDGTSKIVTFQNKKVDWTTGKTYINAVQYGEKKASMFSSILSTPGVDIYSTPHDKLHKIAPVTVINDDYCRLVIHPNNKLSTIKPEDKEEQ